MTDHQQQLEQLKQQLYAKIQVTQTDEQPPSELDLLKYSDLPEMETLTQEAYKDFAKRQLAQAIDIAIKALESAEHWAEKYGTGNEGAWDLNIAKLNAEAAQISAFVQGDNGFKRI